MKVSQMMGLYSNKIDMTTVDEKEITKVRNLSSAEFFDHTHRSFGWIWNPLKHKMMPNIYTQVTRWNLKSTQGCLKTKSVLGRMFDEFCKLQRESFWIHIFLPFENIRRTKNQKDGRVVVFFLSQYNFFFWKKQSQCWTPKSRIHSRRMGGITKKYNHYCQNTYPLILPENLVLSKNTFFFRRKT